MKTDLRKSKRILLLTQEELNELGMVIHSENKESEKEFWEEAYSKRGLIYVSEKDLVSKFDEFHSDGKIHVSLVDGLTVADLSDDDKIQLMRALEEIEIREDKEYS